MATATRPCSSSDTRLMAHAVFCPACSAATPADRRPAESPLFVEAPMRIVALVSALVMAISSSAPSQQPQLSPGQRVRLTAPETGVKELPAILEAIDGSVLAVRADSAFRIPVHAVERLDVHAGRHNHPWRGAAIGAASGVLIGGVVGYLACENYEVILASGTGNCFDSRDGGQLAFWGPVGIGVVAGPVLGFMIGALITTDKWEEVPLDDLRVSVVPKRDGVGIAARLGF